jgi:hypothetical protein
MNTLHVPWRDREQFWNWCMGLGCVPEYQGIHTLLWSHDRWMVPNDHVYLLALLRWA